MNEKEIEERSQDREYKQRWKTDKKYWRENIKLKGKKESDKKNILMKDEKRMVLRKNDSYHCPGIIPHGKFRGG